MSAVSLDLGHAPDSEWYEILAKFDWKSVVAKYVLRDVTMEDHLREYICFLASFLDHTQVRIKDGKYWDLRYILDGFFVAFNELPEVLTHINTFLVQGAL
jgi:hypothetical protein